MWLIVIIPLVVAFLYVLLMMPKMIHRINIDTLRSYLFAHRGLYDRARGIPENSLPAFQKAVEQGYAIELDVRLTKDDVPVVFHDKDLLRVCGKNVKMEEVTYEELRELPLFDSVECVPSLSDVLRLVAGKVPILVEVKADTWNMEVCEKAFEVLEEYEGEFAVESFNPFVLIWMRLHHARIPRGQLATNFKEEGQPGNRVLNWLMKHMAFNFITKPDFIAINYVYRKEFPYWLCRRAYRVPTVAWTVDSRKVYEEIKGTFDSYIFEGFMPGKFVRRKG